MIKRQFPPTEEVYLTIAEARKFLQSHYDLVGISTDVTHTEKSEYSHHLFYIALSRMLGLESKKSLFYVSVHSSDVSPE